MMAPTGGIRPSPRQRRITSYNVCYTKLLRPFTLTPLVAWLLPETGLRVDLAAFVTRVTLIVAAPFVLAWILRRAIGVARLKRNDDVV